MNRFTCYEAAEDISSKTLYVRYFLEMDDKYVNCVTQYNIFDILNDNLLRRIDNPIYNKYRNSLYSILPKLLNKWLANIVSVHFSKKELRKKKEEM